MISYNYTTNTLDIPAVMNYQDISFTLTISRSRNPFGSLTPFTSWLKVPHPALQRHPKLEVRKNKKEQAKDPKETAQQQNFRRCRAHKLVMRPQVPLAFPDVNSRLQCSDCVGCFPSLREATPATPHVSSQISNSLPSAESPTDWACGRLA